MPIGMHLSVADDGPAHWAHRHIDAQLGGVPGVSAHLGGRVVTAHRRLGIRIDRGESPLVTAVGGHRLVVAARDLGDLAVGASGVVSMARRICRRRRSAGVSGVVN